MLDRDLKQAYQKITPSPELKRRILSMHAESREQKRGTAVILKPVMSLAACFVLLLGGMMLATRAQLLQQPNIWLSDADVVGTEANDNSSYFGFLRKSETVGETELLFVPKNVAYTPPTAARTMYAAPAAYSAPADGAAIDLQLSFPQGTVISVEQGVLCLPSEEKGTGEFEQIGQYMSVEREKGMTLVRWVVPMTEEDAEYRMTVGDKTVCVIYRASVNEYRILCIDTEE